MQRSTSMRALIAVVFLSVGCMHNNQSEWLSSDGTEQTSTMPQARTHHGGGGGGGAAWTPNGSCTFNGECPGMEVCTAGSCSSAPSAPSTSSGGCTMDSQCGSGSCQLGTCTAFPPNGCSFDSQCGTGSCQFGQCSPLSR